MKRSKLIALTLSGVLALSSAAILAGCGGKSKAGADTTFTWYLTAGEDGYYSDYEDNPTTTENARSEFNQKYMSGNWEDVIDPTMSRGITEMYEAGVVADLTPYITDRELMPNLNAYLDAHPEYRALMQTQTKDGAKYLSIPTFYDEVSYESQSFGFNYRRDLLVKYGVQPDEFYDPMTDEAPTAPSAAIPCRRIRRSPKAPTARAGRTTSPSPAAIPIPSISPTGCGCSKRTKRHTPPWASSPSI